MPRCLNPRCQAEYSQGTIQCTNPFCQCLLPEAVIAGRYRVETLIGIGGMGTVYRASDTFEMEQIALKVLSLSTISMEADEAIERFRREARYAHQLKHPNIVPVLNFGQDNTWLYITMPLITGGTLKSLLKAERPLPNQQAQNYLNELAAAIDAIHAHPQQIVHRDLKPSNLLIHQDDGRLMVADFGIARAMQQEKALTQRGWSLGTEHYIAPEQEHGQAEPASDIYAMGVVAYQMLTGLLPFQAVVKNKAAELPPPSALNLALPHSVDPVIMKAMEVDPRLRYTSGKNFADAFNEAIQQESFWSEPTIIELPMDTMIATSNANVMVRTIIPDNPCGKCGQENRSTSRFCRYCGASLEDTSPLVTDVCQVGYVSDVGNKERENEDMLLVIQGLCLTLPPPPRPFALFAVADGQRGQHGKSAGGHEASQLAIETVADVLIPLLSGTQAAGAIYPPTANHPETIPHDHHPPAIKQAKSIAAIEQWIWDTMRQANQVVYHCNADYDIQMASTLTLALVYKHHLYISNVGDSRAYYYKARAKTLRCVTRDHTLAANLVDANLLTPDEVYTSPKKDQLYRSIGQNYRVQSDFYHLEVEVDDLCLLCSDGLWHMLRDEEITRILQQDTTDPQKLAIMLVEAANSAGGTGNISAIVVRVQ